MRKFTRLFLVIILLVGCVGCDQVTKVAARAHLTDRPAISYLNDTLRLLYAENTGAFLGLGDSLPKPIRTGVFQGAVSILVFGLISAALFWRGLRRSDVMVLTLLAASGLGNLIDRLLFDGRVTDFLNIGIGSLRTGIFNVADVFGVLAAIIFIFSDRTAQQAAAGDARNART